MNANDEIRLDVYLNNADRAIEALKKLQASTKTLNKSQIKLAVKENIKQANKVLTQLDRQIDAINRKKLEVRLDYSKMQNQMKIIDRLLSNGIIGQKYARYLKNLERQKFSGKWGVSADLDGLYAKFAELDLPIKQAKQSMRELRTEMKAAKQIDITPRFDANKIRRQVSSALRNFGSQMTSLGGALSALTSPIDQLLTGSLYTLAYRGIGAITEGLGGATERYDIMERYPDIISAMGASAKQSEKEVNRLYEAVLGLPTGLDTIVDAQKQYYLSLKGNYKDSVKEQDKALKKASDIAIAANNAFIAGGANDEQIMFGQRQLNDLLSAGKLRNQEWISLAKSMPVAFSEIQKDLHVTRADLVSGKVAADDFIESLIRVSTGDGAIAKAAEKMKHTFNAVQSNIRNALRELGYQSLKTADEILIAYDGGDVIDHLLKIKPAINEISKSIQSWAKANPEKITAFFDSLKRLDVVGIIKGIGSALGTYAKIFMKVLDIFGGDGEKFGKMLIYTNMLGKFLRIFGGGIKGISGGVGNIAWLFANLANIGDSAALLKFKPFNKLRNFARSFTGVKKTVEAVEETGAVAANAAGATASIGTVLTNLVSLVTPAIAIGAYVGAFTLAGLAVKSIAKSFSAVAKTKINFGNLMKNLGKMGVALTAMGLFIKGLGALNLIGGGIGLITNIVGGGTLWAYSKLAEEVAKTMNALSKAKIPSEARFEAIKGALTKIGEFYAEIDTGSFWKSLGRAFRSGNDTKYLKNIQSMTDTIGGVLDNVNGLIAKAKKLAGVKGMGETFDTAKTNLNNVKGFISEFYTLASSLANMDFGTSDVKGGSVGGERKVGIKGATKRFSTIADFVTNSNTLLDAMAQMPDKLIAVQKKMDKLTSAFKDDNGKLNVEAISGNIKNIVSVVEAVVGEGGLGRLKAASDKIAGANIEGITSELGKIPSLLNQIRALYNKFSIENTDWLSPTGVIPKVSEIGTMALGGGGKQKIKTGETNVYGGAINNMITAIGHIVDIIKQIGGKLSQVPDISGNAELLKKGISDTSSAYKSFVALNKYVADNKIDSASLKTTISTLISDLSSALVNAPMLYNNSLVFMGVAKNLQATFKSLSTGKGGSVKTFIGYLKKLPTELAIVSEAMKGKGTQWKNQLVTGFKGTASKIVSEVRSIATSLVQNNPLSSFYNAGASAGNSYSNGFNSSVNLNTDSGGESLIDRIFGNSGGRVGRNGFQYRSKGGSIFPTRGKDRVPAMLAEGEYVVRKSAVDTFGTRFMQKINNLDLGGAIRSLGMRGGQLAFATPNISVDNSKHITYNNNQSVNLTNNHASQGYSESRASRYVRSLK